MRIVAYYRSSTDLQEHSVDMQRTMAFKMAQQKLLVIDDQYPDPSTSARKNNMRDRPELWRLISDIKKGRVQNLLVYKRDRLARTANEYMYIYRLLKEHQVNVIFTADNEHPLSYTAVGEFFEVLMAGVIQREGEQIAKRIRDSKISKFLNKQYAGKVPFGYHVDKKGKERIAKTPGDIEIAREIYDLVLSEKFETLNEIKKYFDSIGRSRTVVKKGKVIKARSWEVQDLEHILTHPLYMGKHIISFEGAGEFEAPYENVAIVSLDEWEKVQQLLPSMITTRAKNESPSIDYHLTGLLFCETCGQSLSTKTRTRDGVKVGMYECTDSSHRCRVRKDHIEHLVLQRAKVLFSTFVKANMDDLLKRYEKSNTERLESKMDELSKEIVRLKSSMVKRTDQYLRELDTTKKESLSNKLMTIYDETDAVQQDYDAFVDILEEVKTLVESPKQLSDDIDAFLDTLPARTADELRTLFRDIVSRIDVGSRCIDITFKHPYVTSKEVVTDVAT
ncbi:recombinase family protein [Alicyclobacillus sp. SO9]|uniref:recombinase family protein n=1 Tax=Alicyclobacillus sp. SO9 TaxID=2665646 RepID=UPI0018E7DE4C|nr:recombinase family protein [Alicyclobacillus sp. SO9]QQE77754.1 recombinase family protein [Alicyclobacillus sp. SO9]